MTLVDPYVVCDNNTHAMPLVNPSVDYGKNTHAMTLVGPYVVCEKNTHAMTTGRSMYCLWKEHTCNDSGGSMCGL